MMMQLGQYQFELNTAMYQQLQRHSAYRWSAGKRVGNTPAFQFGGYDEDMITLNGVVYPEFRGGIWQIERMREQARQGKALLMVSSAAAGRNIFGFWVIKEVQETQSHIDRQNGVPLKQEFMMVLSYYGSRPA